MGTGSEDDAAASSEPSAVPAAGAALDAALCWTCCAVVVADLMASCNIALELNRLCTELVILRL